MMMMVVVVLSELFEVVCSLVAPNNRAMKTQSEGSFWQECDTSHAGLRLMLVKAVSGTRLLLRTMHNGALYMGLTCEEAG